jgi:hypothetical protein
VRSITLVAVSGLDVESMWDSIGMHNTLDVADIDLLI